MTATTYADASSRSSFNWHDVNWCQTIRTVRRLQVRIVKATQAGNWRKVRSLQRLLTRSFSAKLLAVKRVTENQGKRTAGVDGELWDTPAKKAQAVTRLSNRHYKAQPLKRIYIPKADSKRKRPLSIPTLIDRAQQALHLLALDPVAETTGDANSYGFRRERSPADAISRCFQVLSRQDCAQWILEGDIKSCFDRIGHEWVADHIPVDEHCLREWLKAGYMEKDVFHRTEEGVPQGGIVSPVIANMVLDGLEALLAKHHPSHLGRKVHLVRFADDFIITGNSKSLLENDILPLVETFLQQRGLSLSRKKTAITHIDDGFDFLGQTIRKYKGKLRTKPSRQSQRTLLNKVRRIIKTDGKFLTAYGLIRRLNPIIRGWANYHCHVASSRTFARIDYQIYQMLWGWAKRRHRNKSRKWIYNRYFVHPETGRSSFHSTFVNGEGQREIVELVIAARIGFHQHVKIRKNANPYDPAWETYFEQRQYHKVKEELRDQPKLLRQWRQQLGLCPVCHEHITKQTGWHNHHIVWKVHGGGDELSNLVMLHPSCHRQVHSPDYYGPPLRPSVGVRDA